MKITNLLTDDAILTELGQRIASHRVQHYFTQAEVAKEAGVSKRTIENIENGAAVQMTTIIRVLRALNLVDNLDRLIPEPAPSPMEILKQKRKLRVRASGSKRGTKGEDKPWTWKEDK